MRPLILPFDEMNFRWPSKIQSLVYRIFVWRETAPHVGIDQILTTWRNQNSNGFDVFSLLEVNAEHFVEIPTLNLTPTVGNSLSKIKIMFELRGQVTRYNIHIHLGKNMHECCDVENRGGERAWRINGVNIFNVQYASQVWLPISPIASVDLSTIDSNIGKVNSDVFGIPKDLYFPSPSKSRAIDIERLEILDANPRESDQKESEFLSLKEKIAEMVSIVREHDSNKEKHF